MNNTFNINRFGKLLAFDGKKYLRNFGLTLAILCGLNIVMWLLTLIFGFTMPTLPRFIVIYIAFFLGTILVPAKAFGDINLPREGVGYAILPVSTLEKYLSYVCFCLMTPIAIILGSWAIDSLLTLLPFGGFSHYIKHFGFMQIMQDFLMEIGELSGADFSGESIEQYQSIYSLFGPAYNYSIIIGMIFNVGLFMLGNLFFKTHKTGKTLAVMIGVSYVTSMIMQVVLIANGSSLFVHAENIDFNSIAEFTNSRFLFSSIFNTILTIGLYIGLYFKLKTQKY